jgi:copper chaperone CopZ
VERVDIRFEEKKGEVIFDPSKVSVSEIVNKVEQIGFKAEVVGP